MLLALALIPVIGLLIFIYLKDKQEKEPMGFLIGLFFLGMATTISATILETIGTLILNTLFSDVPVLYAILLAMIVVGPAEEMGKYMVLRLRTWNSKHFDYSYDAIVYAVFVSLGFAALENILYVFSKGLTVGLFRMFTAVPGHACFGVFMGFYYSKAKYAAVIGDKANYKKYKRLSMLVPIITHGIYDAILLVASASRDESVLILCFVLWILFVIAMFVLAIICVIKSSKHDYCIVALPGNVQTIYRPNYVGGWVCSCGSSNYLNFCPRCGKQRPLGTVWICPQCGSSSAFNFCGRCGYQKPPQMAFSPAVPAMQAQPMQYQPALAQPMQYQPAQAQPTQYQPAQAQPMQYQPNQVQPMPSQYAQAPQSQYPTVQTPVASTPPQQNPPFQQ